MRDRADVSQMTLPAMPGRCLRHWAVTGHGLEVLMARIGEDYSESVL
jgi:hypothetical protein